MFCCKQLNGMKMVLKMCQTFRRPILHNYLRPAQCNHYNMKHVAQFHCTNNLHNQYALKYDKDASFLDCFMTDHIEDHFDKKQLPAAGVNSFLQCFMTDHAEDHLDKNQPSDCGVENKPKKSKKTKNKLKRKAKNNEKYQMEVQKREAKTNFDEEDDGVRVSLKQPFKLHRLKKGPAEEVYLSRAKAKLYYKQMQTIRRIETISDALYKEKAIRGFCHLYSGQEACAVGIKASMRPQDNIITAYRCHGWSYLMNISPLGILAELMGRQTGVQRGKGGSMHMYAPHFYGGNGIVGAQVPLGAGIALTNKYKKDGGVTFACYGDGAANQGQVFEAFNMAYLWKLPCVFVCENNNYGMGTAAARAASNTKYYKRGDLLPGIRVDGMNVLAVRSAAEYAIDYASKKGPIVIEANTYRYSGHSMSDPGTSYRSREEIQEVRQNRDPIMNFRKLCVEKELLTTEETKIIDKKIDNELDEVVAKAKAEPEIPLEELTADIYAINLESMIRGQRGFTLSHKQIKKAVNQ